MMSRLGKVDTEALNEFLDRTTERAFVRKKRETELLSELFLPRRWIVALTCICVILFLWAAFAPLRMVVRAEGRVEPSTRNQIVQHLEGGVILSIDVAEGKVVHKGDLLARIIDVQANAILGERKIREVALIAKVARLKAEASGRELFFPEPLDENTQIVEAIRIEQEALDARRQRLNNDKNTLSEQVKQKRSELTELITRADNLKKELALAQKQFQIIHKMLEQEAASELEYLDAQSKVQKLRSQLSEAAATIPRLRAAVSEAEGRSSELESRFFAEARTELTTAQTELQRVQEELKASNDRITRTELRAPISGIINKINVSTIGGVIGPGEAVMEIIPLDKAVVIEAKVRPSDRLDLHLGLPVHVRFSAYDYASFGLVGGHLTEISADTLPDENGERFYRVRVSIDDEQHGFSGQPILPGMIATAEIVVGSRTVLSYLISPLNRFASVTMTEHR